MTQKINKITLFQMFTLIAQIQIGTEILSLPHRLHEFAKQDSWISLLISGVVVQLTILLIWGVMRRYPGLHFFQICDYVLGRWAGIGISVLYMGYFTFVNTLFLLNIFDILFKWAYPLTPKWMTLGLIVLVSVYMGRQNIKVIARICLIATFLHLFFIGIALYVMKDGTWLNMLPIGQTPLPSLLLGTKTSVMSILGFEIMFAAYPAVLGSDKQILKSISIALWYVIGIYVLIMIACLVYLSSERLDQVTEPVLYVLSRFTFGVIERIDLIFLSFWILSFITSFVGILYLGSVNLAHLVQHDNHSRFVPWVALVPFLFALSQHHPFVVVNWTPYLELYAVLTLVGIPFVLLLGSFIKQREGLK